MNLHRPLQFAVFFTSIVFVSAAQANNNVDSEIKVNGDVAAIKSSTSTLGFTFDVRFDGVKYDGKVHKFGWEARGKNRFRLKIHLRNVRLTFGSVAIRGSRHSADCGPMNLRLGVRRDLVVNVDVDRDAEGRLRIVKRNFKLDADNIAIGTPSWIRTRGWGMTESRVSEGLRSGLVTHVKTVEKKLFDEIPNIVEQCESEINTELAAKRVALK